jgi:Na+-driven multidrug efflux pump
LTVALHGLWILPPPLFLIVRMFLSPLLLTFQGDLVILGVSRKFLAVIIGAAPTLALRLTAHALLRTISGG